MPRVSLKAAVFAAAAGFAAMGSGIRQGRAAEIPTNVSTEAAAGNLHRIPHLAAYSRAKILGAGRALARAVGKDLLQSPSLFNPDGSAARPNLLANAPKAGALNVPPGSSPSLAPPGLSKPAAAGEAVSPPPSAAASAPPPKPHKMFEDRAYLISSIAFHAAGAFDLASTIYGIAHIPWESEGNPVFLKLFGKKSARNIPLITGGWIATHLSVQFVARFLFRRAKKAAKKHHKYKRFLFDAAALGLLAFGVIWHIDAASTWYGPGRL